MNPSLLQDLAVILLTAGCTAVVFHRLNQPKVVGYVLAGLIIGPFTPPFSLIQDERTIRTLADIGVVFLMFSLGLDFNLRRLRRAGATAILTALLDVSIMVWLGYLLGRRMGWTPVESLFLGAILCDSSTTILAKSLGDLGRIHDRFAGIAVGITLVEDVLAVGMLAVLTGLATTGAVQPALVAERLWHLLLFLVLVTVVGLLTVPRALNRLQRFRNEELLAITVTGLCFGVALLAVRLELSLALGAVLIGAIVSESRALPRIAALTDPLRHVFSAVFFVTIGMFLNPASLRDHWSGLAAVTALVVAGKFAANTAGVLLTGHRLSTSLLAGAGMAQIGEFAFIISALALSLDIGRHAVYQVGVAAAVLTIVLNPYLLRLTDALLRRLRRDPRGRRWIAGIRFYSQWMEQLRPQRQPSAVRRVVRRSVLIITVNLILVAAIFGLAGFLAKATAGWGLRLPGPPAWYPVFWWLAAATLSLPLYVATFRKHAALAMILAEAALPLSLTAAWARPVRTFLTHAITMAGGVGLAVLTFILSSTLLPSLRVFLLLAALALVGAVRAQRRLSLVYGRAQMALQTMLEREPPPAPAAWADLAPDTELQPLVIGPAAGRTLRSLDLRGRTGVTVIALERGGTRTTNPDPDDPFRPGDRVFLLGAPEQVRAARAALLGNPPA